LVTSAFILTEFEEKPHSKFQIPKGSIQQATSLLHNFMQVVTPSPLPSPVCRDADDDWLPGTALAGDCHCVITGDKDLLQVQHYQISPSLFWAYEAKQRLRFSG
jgi:uncharacterized protein